MDGNYYANRLNAQKLYRVYETAVGRVQQYLDSEIAFVRGELKGDERILELGAGYGRIMRALAPFAASIAGVEISAENVAMGREYLKDCPNCRLEVLDVHALSFDEEFDILLGLQNTLSAVKGDPLDLATRCMKALVFGGRAYFSTYSPAFWLHRLAWFEEQAEKGLLGEIDRERTRDGEIVCKDGFCATTYTREDFEKLARAVGCPFRIHEVDETSLFLILEKR